MQNIQDTQFIQGIETIQYIQYIQCINVHAIHTVHTMHTIHTTPTVHRIHTVHAIHIMHTIHTIRTTYLYVCATYSKTQQKQTRSNASRLGRTHPGLARTYTNANFTILQISAGVANQFCGIVEYQLHIQYINVCKTHNVYNTHKAATVRSNRQAHLATANSTFYPESFSWLP